MMFPAREVPEEEPGRTSGKGAAGMPADAAGMQDPSPADAETFPAYAHDTAAADADETLPPYAEGVAYDPPQLAAAPPPDAGPARAGMPVHARSPADAGPPVEAATGNQWSDIMAMFVDDPRGSVAEASVMVDEAVEALIATARERQASLAASWQAADADTEQLRVALREYRVFWSAVARLPQPA